MLSCDTCKHWDSGEGGDNCFDCGDLNHAMKYTSKRIREYPVSYNKKPILNIDYKEVLHQVAAEIATKKFRMRKTPALHRAILILSIFGFRIADITTVFNLSRTAVYKIYSQYPETIKYFKSISEEDK